MSSPEVPLDQPGYTSRKNRRVQLAAVVALVAAIAIAWIALSMVADDPIGLIFAFGAIFLLVYSGSFLLIRRGRRRFLVLPLAFFALVALIGYGYDQKYQMLILAAALAVFGFSARYAARHQPDSAHMIHRHARPAQPAQTGVLIINPRSGGGKAARFNLTEEARKRSIELGALRVRVPRESTGVSPAWGT